MLLTAGVKPLPRTRKDRAMSINCTQCRTELPEQAGFCWRCGHVGRTGITRASDSIAYETCEVVYGKSVSTGKTVFWARALGDGGSYTAAESVPLQYEALTYLGVGSRPALDGLMADLVGQG